MDIESSPSDCILREFFPVRRDWPCFDLETATARVSGIRTAKQSGPEGEEDGVGKA